MKLSVLPEHHDIYPIHQQLDINEILNSIKNIKLYFQTYQNIILHLDLNQYIVNIKNEMISPNTGKSNFFGYFNQEK